MNRIFLQSPATYALVATVVIFLTSFYLGKVQARLGSLYYFGVLAPSAVLSIVVGLWTWNWEWFWVTLGFCVVLTTLLESLAYLFWR